MPRLYGNPFKHELRARHRVELRTWEQTATQIQVARNSLSMENLQLKGALLNERARCAELESKLVELEQKLSDLAGSLTEFRQPKDA
jgi:chromosome segregation ATPase